MASESILETATILWIFILGGGVTDSGFWANVMSEKVPLIPKHGGYRKLKSFQVARLIYDVTVRFCER
jgi:hypothetical protein